MATNIGQIRLFAGNFAPRDWVFCEGQLLPIAQFQQLFSMVGTKYGGDGRTTFALPDLRGRVPVSASTDSDGLNISLGEKTGSDTNMLTPEQLPSHSHSHHALNVPFGPSTSIGSNSDKISEKTAIAISQYKSFSTSLTKPVLMGKTDTVLDSENAGSGFPMPNMQPSIAINYIIRIS